ncbi:uncharacterized protein LOC8287960 isoform X1 [Ricinus communis]|uniref:uncharacterized protein LOC8287960 isoform X1 n=1 Tax=Ricinus communis TaxID=3988 RepID=UPI00201A837A|nr:uncharacterized protein LOC8287960 isoform X1 [Ricinus communis]
MRAVATAVTQRSRGCEDDVMFEYDIEELPCAISGYTLLHLSWPLIRPFITLFILLHINFKINSGPVNYGPLHLYQMELMVRETCVLFLESLVCQFQGDLLGEKYWDRICFYMIGEARPSSFSFCEDFC